MLLNTYEDIGLAVNAGKTNHMQVGPYRSMMAHKHLTAGSNSLEKVKNFKYLGFLLANQNFLQEETKFRLKTGILCYYSVQTLLSFSFLSKNLNMSNLKIKSVDYSSQGSHTGQLDFCNGLADSSTTG